MKEASVGFHHPVPSDGQSAEVAEPGDRPLDDPAFAVAPELAPILARWLLAVGSMGNDGPDAPLQQALPQRVAVVAPICDQALGTGSGTSRAKPSDRDRLERFAEELDLRGRRRVQVCSQRSTHAICQNHPLRALAAFGLADAWAPFLAGAKEPSTKHSSQGILPRSFSCARKARHSSSRTPFSSHSLSLRQQVVELPYWLGSSLQGAPVHRIHRMPSKHLRSSVQGRPPFALGLRGGRWDWVSFHCRSVRPRHAIATILPAQDRSIANQMEVIK
jgi:hypothetical protein